MVMENFRFNCLLKLLEKINYGKVLQSRVFQLTKFAKKTSNNILLNKSLEHNDSLPCRTVFKPFWNPIDIDEKQTKQTIKRF